MWQIWLILIFILCIIIYYNKYHSTLIKTNYSRSSNSTFSTKQLIGHQGIVTKSIGENLLETGLVKLDHEIWPAISASGDTIPKGKLVEVNTIKGVHLVVSSVHQKKR